MKINFSKNVILHICRVVCPKKAIDLKIIFIARHQISLCHNVSSGIPRFGPTLICSLDEETLTVRVIFDQAQRAALCDMLQIRRQVRLGSLLMQTADG